MTEAEAKTKWCFHFIASHTNPRQRQWCDEDHAPETLSSEPTGPFLHHCIASACMAWRATDNYAGPFAPDEPEPASQPAGYCGLAGAPQ